MKPNEKQKTVSDPIKRIELNGGNGAREVVIQIARALGFKIHEDGKGVSAYGGNSIRLANHCTYMQTWVDKGTWNAPIRLDIVIEDAPTQAITQVKDGYDFTITEFVSSSNTITPQMARMIAYDIKNTMNGNRYANNIRGERRNLIATHGNNQENINCNRNMNKKLIRLTEADLHRIVKESVNKIITELGWKTYANAAKKSYEIAREKGEKSGEKDRERAYKFATHSDDVFNHDFGGYDRYVDDDGYTVDYHYGRIGSPYAIPTNDSQLAHTLDRSMIYPTHRHHMGDTHSVNNPGERSFTNYVYDFDDYEDNVTDAYWPEGEEFHSSPRLKDGKYPLRDRGNKETSDYVNRKYHYEKGKGWKK